jgi:uncharacterized protein
MSKPSQALSGKTAEIAALGEKLERLIAAVERLSSPAEPPNLDLESAEAFVWQPEKPGLQPVKKINRVDMPLLRGIERVKKILIENTHRFAQGHAANNVLLWGARGMGKSSLVKASQEYVNQHGGHAIKLIEIHREDIDTLPILLNLLRDRSERVILFCDDLSFDHDDSSYKSLKAALDGGVEGRPDNVIFYATSNRRHLLPRDMMENERSTAINPSEAVEEKVSLSDRFGLWLGFHKCNQEDYLEMVKGYVEHYGLDYDPEQLNSEALEWATTRGARSGRVAWQFIQDLAGRHGRRI